MHITRRRWLGGLAAGSILTRLGTGGAVRAEAPAAGPVFIATWKFGQPVVDAAWRTYQAQRQLLDAIERGIWVAEEDASNATVGLGGAPNAEGVVQLDACIMRGADHQAGSVAALEGFLHPISVARRVMEKTPHVMLVGAGARRFALEQGFEETNLLTPERRAAWLKWKQEQEQKRKQPAVEPDATAHDTITLLGCLPGDQLAGGCSTSGWAYKLPGRVGDSPIIGSGLYVDNEVGAAGATGLGENIMRHCGAFLVVELMRAGATPTEACAEAALRILRKLQLPKGKVSVNFLALNRAGQFGAAGTDAGFTYAVATEKGSRLEQPKILENF